MMIISLLFVVVMIAGIYFYRSKNRAAPANRYRKSKNTPRSAVQAEKENNENHFHDDAYAEKDEHDALGLKTAEKTPHSSSASPAKSSSSQSDCVVVLYLMAPKGSEYAGYELLQALLSAGMRYGKQRIFNRHEHKDGRGDILFHCASAVAPGTFDLTKMGAFSCAGLCLFFTASSVEEPLSTFDCLLETIDQLIEDIGGQVLDEKRALFTKDRMVKYRQQIRAFENGKMTVDMFE
ncbi:MAG: cell division protein [uncultured bacterium]|nr:MAG: cell division protein [uncultured bacterium]